MKIINELSKYTRKAHEIPFGECFIHPGYKTPCIRTMRESSSSSITYIFLLNGDSGCIGVDSEVIYLPNAYFSTGKD